MTCKAKKKAHAKHMADTQMQTLQSNPTAFWRTMFPKSRSGNTNPGDAAECTAYSFQSLFMTLPPITTPHLPVPLLICQTTP